MEKNTKKYDFIRNKFEECLRSLKFTYKAIDLEDDDINYDVRFHAPKLFKSLGSLQGVMFANLNENSITLIVVNIYNIPSERNITPFYKLVNDVNNVIMHGKFSVKKDIRQIIYRASVDCGENFLDLTEKKIKLLIDDFGDNIMPLFMAIYQNDIKNKNVESQ